MPIYKSKLAEVDVPVAEDEVVCDWSAFTSTSGTPGGDPGVNMRGSILQELIYIIYRWRNNSTNFPHYRLYDYQITGGVFDNIFKKIILTNSGTSIPQNGNLTPQDIFLNTNGDPDPSVTNYLPKLLPTLPDLRIFIKPDNIGYVVEACMIYSMYYHVRILAKITGYQLDVQNPAMDDIFYLNSTPQLKNDKKDGSDWAESNMPTLYSKLRNALFNETGSLGISGGLNKPTDNDYPHVFNKWTWERFVEIFDPKFRFGTPDTDFQDDPKLSTRFKFGLRNSFNPAFELGHYKYKQAYKIIHDALTIIKYEELLKEAKCLFHALLSNKHEFNASFVAVGDGSETKGLFGIENLGVCLFNYRIELTGTGASTGIKLSKDISETKFELNNYNSIVHFSGFGFDDDLALQNSKRDLVFSLSSREIEKAKFEGQPSIQEWDPGTATGIEVVNYPPPDIFLYKRESELFAKYNKATGSLNFKNKEKDNLNIRLTSGNEVTTIADELLVLYSTVNPKAITKPYDDDGLFDSDKFEIQEAVLNKILASEPEKLFLKEIGSALLNPSNPAAFDIPLLYGNFVGMDSGSSVIKVKPDPAYWPSDSATEEERSGVLSGDNKLMYSYANLTLDYSEDPTKVKIEINSFVSPQWSRLDQELNPLATGDGFPREWYNTPVITPAQIASFTISGYEVKPGVASYNQALCMLRSMGLLEAILYRLYVENGSNSNLLTIINSFLQNANTVARDRTIEVRPGLSTSMQLTNTITYDFYKRAKWYKASTNHDDKNLYLTFPF